MRTTVIHDLTYTDVAKSRRIPNALILAIILNWDLNYEIRKYQTAYKTDYANKIAKDYAIITNGDYSIEVVIDKIAEKIYITRTTEVAKDLETIDKSIENTLPALLKIENATTRTIKRGLDDL